MEVVRPDPAEWQREREEARKAKQAAIDSLRAGFTRPENVAEALAAMQAAIAQFAAAHSCPVPDFDQLWADAQGAGTTPKIELAIRKSLNEAYKLRSEKAHLADALAYCLLHMQMILEHKEPRWKVATAINRLASNLNYKDYRRACIGFFMVVGDEIRSSCPDISSRCDDEVASLFSSWQADDEAEKRFRTGLNRIEQTASVSDTHFVINDLVEYLDRRRRFDPGLCPQLVELCEKDISLYKRFLVEFHQDYGGKKISFTEALQKKSYICPRLPSFDALWNLYEEASNLEGMRRLKKIASEIRYTSGEMGDSSDETDTPEIEKTDEGISSLPTEIIEVQRSGQKGKLAFCDRSGGACGTEEAAIDYFHGLGFRTLRGEVHFWQAMFGLTFWEEIFDGTGTPNFLNDIPMDLFSGAPFYEARKARIEQKAAAIASSNVAQFLLSQFRCHGDTWTRIIYESERGDFSYRQVLQSQEVEEFLSLINPSTFAKIVHRIALNPNSNRSGLPDYMIWKDGVITFIEVKGIREKIRESQAAWLLWMLAEGISIKVVRVKGIAPRSEVSVHSDGHQAQ
jgi:hypothetical protein